MSCNFSFISSAQAAIIDSRLMSEDVGFSLDQLMELAGLAIAQIISGAYPKQSRILIVCGPGNNGGDGLVAARHLAIFGYLNVKILYPKQTERNPIYKRLVQLLEWHGIKVIRDLKEIANPTLDSAFDVLVDSIFGFGFKGSVRSPFDEIIEVLNQSHLPIVCIDIPSGWPRDGGVCIRNPSVIISLMAPKQCLASDQMSAASQNSQKSALAAEMNVKLPEFEVSEFKNFFNPTKKIGSPTMDEPKEWHIQFREDIKKRNAAETDCFIEIFKAYSISQKRLNDAASSKFRWTPVAVANDPSESDEESKLIYFPDSKSQEGIVGLSSLKGTEILRRLHSLQTEKTNLEESNIVLRDQVRALEATLRATEVELKASHVCLRELEKELRGKEHQIQEGKKALAFLTEENHNLLETKIRLERESNSNRAERLKLSERSAKAVDYFVEASGPTLVISDSPPLNGDTNDDVSPACVKHDESIFKPVKVPARTAPKIRTPLASTLSPFSLPLKTEIALKPRVKIIAHPHRGAVTCLDISIGSHVENKESLLASGGYDGYAACLNAETLRVMFSFKTNAQDSAITHVRLSSDRKRTLAACLDGSIFVALTEKQKIISVLHGQRGGRTTGCWFLYLHHLPAEFHEELVARKLMNGHICCSVSSDRLIRIWDLEKSACVSVAKALSSITAACLTTCGRFIFGHQNGTLTIWMLQVLRGSQEISLKQTATVRPLAPPSHNTNASAIHEDSVTGLCCGADDLCYSLGRDGRLTEISILRAAAGKSMSFLGNFRPASASAAPVASPCGRYVAAPGQSGIFCWDTNSGKCLCSWPTPTATTSITFDHDKLISGHADGSLILWWL